jgi:serine/threonine protein kinase
MAELWLARQTGLQGFERLVVLKRILPHLAADPQFVEMFLDEARTVADLRHANLVTVTDIGADEGAWFIVMEYLEGRNLEAILRRAQSPIPLEYALQIVIEAARGLEYAHEKTDLNGTALKIVHRDVSPQNLFVTFDGVTKVLDFGIATAAGRATQTEAGIVKGKFGYMSPEQVDGAELDPRSDLFTLGIVLFELVTGQKLFTRDNEADTLRAVLSSRVPRPSTLREGLPAGLDAIVLRALAKDPAHRFESCGALADALAELVDEHWLSRSPGRLGAWLKAQFPERSNPLTGDEPALTPEPTRNDRTPVREVADVHTAITATFEAA